ncbi:MAG: hypothetical protein HEEMFOPI_00272 [Holosporales bacterium]
MEKFIYFFAMLFFVFLGIKARNKKNNCKNSHILKKYTNTFYPDFPLSFGYKISWMAIKTEDVEKVIEHLPINTIEKSNWENGLNCVFDKNTRDNCIFVSPSISGWVFIVGYAYSNFDFANNKIVLNRVAHFSSIFENCYCFCNDRINDFYAWIIGSNGYIKRAIIIGQGELIHEKGEITSEEKSLKINIKNEDGIFAIDEDVVLSLAECLSFNPMFLDNIKEQKIGYIARLKDK